MLTQKRLREVLNYDPETGLSTWVRGARAGEPAGALHDDRGFLKVSIDGQRHLLHRLAWLWMTGAMSRSTVEHMDGDRSNNGWTNLREGDRMQKALHRGPPRRPTHVEGVWSVGERFEAAINVEGLTLSLGGFATARQAHDAITLTRCRARDQQRRNLRAAA